MSKVGKQPISIDPACEVTILENKITLKGKEGVLSVSLPREIQVKNENSQLIIEAKDTERALHGLYRTLISNAALGVNKKWEKVLEIVGTGYRTRLQGQDLILEVGYSHPVIFKKIENVDFVVEGTNKIIVRGVNKELVGQIAHKIKMVRKPDPYKGKGIRYAGEHIKLKLGKKAKAVGGGK